MWGQSRFDRFTPFTWRPRIQKRVKPCSLPRVESGLNMADRGVMWCDAEKKALLEILPEVIQAQLSRTHGNETVFQTISDMLKSCDIHRTRRQCCDKIWNSLSLQLPKTSGQKLAILAFAQECLSTVAVSITWLERSSATANNRL